MDKYHRLVFIYSHIITYGNAADEKITALIREEIETLWNEPKATVYLKGIAYNVIFSITARFQPTLTDMEVYTNLDPSNNYFRIEAFSHNQISFVDGLGCNSGYFKLDNLYPGSTTAAHEYGHTLGLEHPTVLDLRGKGQPGIMYPRGTLTDPEFQYEPQAPAGTKGGTLHPRFRKVLQEDIDQLKLEKIILSKDKNIIGAFTNIFHQDHAGVSPFDFFGPASA